MATEEIEVDLVTDDGDEYTGTFTGELVAEGRRFDVYVGADERVLVYHRDEKKVDKYLSAEEAAEQLDAILGRDLPFEEYVSAMAHFGLKAKTEI